MKISRNWFWLIAVATQLLIALYIVQDYAELRSQNAFYHSRLASIYQTGQSPSQLQVLSGSTLANHFVDQHALFHRAVGVVQNFTDSGRALFTMSLLGLLALTSLLAYNLRRQALWISFFIPLLLLWPLEPYLSRWLSSRPGIWSAFFLLLILLQFRKSHWRSRDLAIFGALAFLWSSFSLVAWISLPLAMISMWGPLANTFRTASVRIYILLALLLGLLTGGLWAQGFSFFEYSWIQIQGNVLQSLGVFEWSAPRGQTTAYLVPVTINLVLLLALLWPSFQKYRSSVTADATILRFLVFGVGLSILSLAQMRWIELAWPLTLLNLGFSFQHWQWPTVKKWRQQAAAGLAILWIGFQIEHVRQLPQADGSINPGAQAFLSTIRQRFPQAESVLTLDWTLWSVDFYLNQNTKMQPGFSLSFYRNDPNFVAAYRSLYRQENFRRFENYSYLLRHLNTRFVIANENQLSLDLAQDWFQILYRAQGLIFAEIHPEFHPLPQQLSQSFNSLESLLPFCDQKILALRRAPDSPVFVDSSQDCKNTLSQWAKPTPANNLQPVIEMFLDPKPIHHPRQISTALTRGFFAIYDPGLQKIRSDFTDENLAPDSQAVFHIRGLIRPADYQLHGRRKSWPQPKAKQLCSAYHSATRRLLDKADKVFLQWSQNTFGADALRARVSLSILCQRPKLIPLTEKSRWAETCSRYQSRLEAETKLLQQEINNKLPGDWSERLLIDMATLQSRLPSPLAQVTRDQIVPVGFFKNSRVPSFQTESPQGLTNLRLNFNEVFTSGHFALWWTERWKALDRQGFAPSSEELQDFEDFALRSEKYWRHEMGYNSFAIRWWSEALVNAYLRNQSPQASHWMEQFFRSAETFVQGSTLEKAPECLGPKPPGFGTMYFPHHNAAVIWEGLEQARRANFPWWSDKEEELILKMMRCTLSLQKDALFWPTEEVGEFALTPGDGTWRVDTQAHALNALGLRLENDEQSCHP